MDATTGSGPAPATLHRVEALPGGRRYALTFVRPDGGEQTAVAQVDGPDVHVPDASLPVGWAPGGELVRAGAEAVLALERARSLVPRAAVLSDVDGGWDVGLGNVVLGGDGSPTCTAHGAMAAVGGVFECAECGARAALGA